jgi:hypothetical protein
MSVLILQNIYRAQGITAGLSGKVLKGKKSLNFWWVMTTELSLPGAVVNSVQMFNSTAIPVPTPEF